jgi:hypothetical protein
MCIIVSSKNLMPASIKKLLILERPVDAGLVVVTASAVSEKSMQASSFVEESHANQTKNYNVYIKKASSIFFF